MQAAKFEPGSSAEAKLDKLEALLGPTARNLPRDLAQVIARTDGVPLFIEELTSTLLESGLLRETTDRYVHSVGAAGRCAIGNRQARTGTCVGCGRPAGGQKDDRGAG
jgi:hypothetical protein